MIEGIKNLCGLLSAVLSTVASLSAFYAVTTNDRAMLLQAVVFGIAGAGVALAALLRM